MAAYSPTGKHPVQVVSWYDALMFCNWLSAQENRSPCYELTGETEKFGRFEFPAWRLTAGGTGYRLPTEAEWEYACRAGTTTANSSGEDDKLLAEYAVFQASETEFTGSRRCNGWGLFDMQGNVSEWCNDRHEPYGIENLNDPGENLSRILRGGSFFSNAKVVRLANRNHNVAVGRNSAYGIRVARTYP